MPRPGENFHGYLVGRMLGRGGSATVFLAHQGAPADRPVALKVLAPGRHTEAVLDRMHREFDFAHRLPHPHIVEVYKRGPDWLTMQYVDGGDATSLPDLDRRLEALTQIADALDNAHHHGVVHCDVKPANILVHQNFSLGGAVLIDFGVARSMAEDMAVRLARDATARLSLDPARRITHQRLEHPATVQASLPYAAPELLTGRAPSAATDEYALACTAVELITGAAPFTASTTGELIDAHLYQAPPRVSSTVPWIPHAVDSILARALAKNPDLRYETCREMIEHLIGNLRSNNHDNNK